MAEAGRYRGIRMNEMGLDFPDDLASSLKGIRTRRVGVVPGGSFAGSRLSGEVLEGGSDWQSLRGDGSTALNVRLVLKTDDGALIGMRYEGMRHGPEEIIARLESGETVEAESYYFRIAPLFETGAKQHAWLNKVVAIGTGHRTGEGPVYSVFEVL